MATKVTTVSLDPNFKTFEEWADIKMAEFRENGNTATAEEWIVAFSTKAQAEAAISGYTREVVDPKTVILSEKASTPEFDAIMELWIAEYDIEYVSEEV
jgi:hypothetical protein